MVSWICNSFHWWYTGFTFDCNSIAECSCWPRVSHFTDEMQMCEVLGCSNRASKASKSTKSFIVIPDPKKDPVPCQIWLCEIGTKKILFRLYKHSRSLVVCRSHFDGNLSLDQRTSQRNNCFQVLSQQFSFKRKWWHGEKTEEGMKILMFLRVKECYYYSIEHSGYSHISPTYLHLPQDLVFRFDTVTVGG